MKNLYVLTLIASVFMLASCGTAKVVPFAQTTLPDALDYSKNNSWAALPGSYPDALIAVVSSNEIKKADVFFIYPTLFSDKKDPAWNADVKDPEVRNEVIELSVANQASAFATAANVYVPFYRQAHIKIFNEKHRELVGSSWDIAYQDVKRAFEYYLKHYNNGRPIIIAGHSQGSMHGSALVKEFFDGTALQDQLVAAYLPGAGVALDYFEELPLLTEPGAIGGFVSWNTYKIGNVPKHRYETYYKGRSTTNPITWDASVSTTLKQHKGLLYYDKEVYPQSLNIELIDGMVWATVPKVPKRFFMSFIKNYHAFDINLFWKDISDNAELRTQNWINASSQ
jgi:hypothetical protein